MVDGKIKKEWEMKLEELDVKGEELKRKAVELESEIERLEIGLSQDGIRKYRVELVGKLKRELVCTFRERDNLIEPMSGSMEEWNAHSSRLKALIIIHRVLDTEEASSCRDVPELKNFLRDRLNSELGGNVEEEIYSFLEGKM